MIRQRIRQLNRYRKYSPAESKEYKKGKGDASLSVIFNIRIECPYHTDSGRYLRWTQGYQDELLYISKSLYDRVKRNNLPYSYSSPILDRINNRIV